MNNIKNMININKKIILILSTFILLFNFNSVAETSYPNTSIAIIDYSVIFKDSKAAINALKQFESIRKSTEDELIDFEKKLLDEKNKLIEQQSVIAPEAFQLKAKDYEKKLQDYQVDKQNKLRKLDGLIQKVNFEIMENVRPILEDLSKELGVTVILEKNSVVLNANNMDVTDDVIKELNKKLPKIKVTLD